ncbi:hypothetical protein DFH06DRAFT_1446658 [Mycena polygramma]|nr:hypothetical protein DFH06DRAFT_1446658 [Mycena polygramma]
MNFLAALLASFVAVAVANPVNNVVVPKSVLEARVPCDLAPFLNCTGGITQEAACNGDGWTCPGNGLHPVTSNATCVAQCTCEIPCPGA